ncbi:MAG: glycosyl hydrolase [Planctomycetota bacterium]|nr:MAG: glycosyl hydrolase [Planctomycetota bacterium]
MPARQRDKIAASKYLLERRMPKVKAKSLWFTLLFVSFLSVASRSAEQPKGMSISSPSVERQVEEILSRMTLDEKITVLHGNSTFSVGAVKRLGIPELTLSDGPHGIRQDASENRDDYYVTAMPVGVALAATWNIEMARLMGNVIGAEARNCNKQVLLGPGVNMMKTPLCGRNFEYYSEDPYLAGKIAVEYIKGVQQNDVAACAKHYALNNQEKNRCFVDARPDERTLREIYLPAFEMAVKEGKVWCVMGSYNKVRGKWSCENKHLARDILKGQWGFDGVYISDWCAVHSTVDSAINGLDLEMGTNKPYDQYFFAAPLKKAVQQGQVPLSVVDDKVRRVLRLMFRTKLVGADKPVPGSRNTRAHQIAARKVAEEAVVLLKNNGVLPIDINKVKKIAVIGENANMIQSDKGGSSSVKNYLYEITPLEGIKRRVGRTASVTFAQGYISYRNAFDFDMIPEKYLSSFDPVSGAKGWRGEYFASLDLSGKPTFVRYDSNINFKWLGAPADNMPEDNFSVRWTGTVVAPASGEYEFGLLSDDGSRMFIDGEMLIDNWWDHGPLAKTRKIELEKGKEYNIVIEYYDSGVGADVKLGWRGCVSDNIKETVNNNMIAEAVAVAKDADVVFVFVGHNHYYDDEGRDKADIKLGHNQDELIEALTKANPKTVALLTSGGALEMPWVNDVPAVLQMWYLGMESGNAVANILFGDVNPSGKLPMTFPKKLEDIPAHKLDDYKVEYCDYKEGILVGYRWFDTKNVEPLFAFGHGLSYTKFEYTNVRVRKSNEDGVLYEVQVDVKNTGDMAGAEVVQMYIADEESSLMRPEKELKGFRKVFLKPGDKITVSMPIDKRMLSFYDPTKKAWVAESGAFKLLIGSSSRDIRVTANLQYE